ncbi:MAG: hydrogenase 4 subunit B [Hyphomicrobiaceae bacterium]|nr:MAG: hydrogenase 4 subunit B [Hyphomicrobiaceae bacterium]
MLMQTTLTAIAVLLTAGVLAVTLQGRFATSRIIYLVCLAACLALLAGAASHLLSGSSLPIEMSLPMGLPWVGVRLRIDQLTAFFQFVINLGAAAASLFALGYGQHEHAPGRVLPFYPVFLAGMNIVLLADDAFSFLVSWEFMSLSSWALVISSHREEDNTRAGYIYILMASFGTLALLLAFGLLAGPAGSYGFAEMRSHVTAPWLGGLVLALALAGTGSKAGLAPLHIWLPLAHPAAPSHVSALMSGVMTKVAIYGFLRIVFDLLGSPAWWWSLPVLALGSVTAVLGVLFAIMQRDLKRLLAYSTIENIGIVFIGLALALAFKASALHAAAALALTAALFHVLNHSLFKSLLFFVAGSVLTATGERDIEKLGGLVRSMPQTTAACLGGCLAISALPPLNGFVSEWLMFQSILLSPNLSQWALKLMVPAAGAMLALGAALSAACFVRAFGITFLGRPRSDVAANARETDRLSLSAMFILLALCFAAGLFPGLVIDAMSGVVELLAWTRMPTQASIPWLSIVPIAESRSSYNGLLVFVFITISTFTAVQVIHRFASDKLRRGPAWDCGYPEPSPLTQYSGDSFSQPVRRVFGPIVLDACDRVDMPLPGDPRPARLSTRMRDLPWEILYAPIAAAIWLAAEKLNKLQFLTIRKYLSLVFAALIALLLAVAIW